MELSKGNLKLLTGVFWVTVGITSVTWIGSIAHKIIERRHSVRTEESAKETGMSIPVPATLPAKP